MPNQKRAGAGYQPTHGAMQLQTELILAPTLCDAMVVAGITTEDVIAPTGTVQRFHVKGDRPGSRNGWVKYHADAHGTCAMFGSHRFGTRFVWSGKRCSRRDRREIAAQQRDRAAERAREQMAAQERAQDMWRNSRLANPSHPYLVAKRVFVHGIRQAGGSLIVPMQDTDGQIWNIQSIWADGTKRFLSGGRKKGLFFEFGWPMPERIFIGEGFATCASVLEMAPGPISVVVAFDAGNLEPVACAIRARNPSTEIVIAADNDVATQLRTGLNPGMIAARNAARAANAKLMVPPDGWNDWNDFARGTP